MRQREVKSMKRRMEDELRRMGRMSRSGDIEIVTIPVEDYEKWTRIWRAQSRRFRTVEKIVYEGKIVALKIKVET